MAKIPRNCFVQRSLAAWGLATSVFLTAAQPSMARPSATSPAAISSSDGEVYLQRQLLMAKTLQAQGNPAALDGVLDRILSLLAAVDRPEAAPMTLAHTTVGVLEILTETDRTERAWGLYRATAPALARLLPAASLDALTYHLTEAELRARMGDLSGAAAVLQAAAVASRALEADDATRRDLLARALSARAVVCARLGDLDGARVALAEHPDAALYLAPGRAPANEGEVTYLVARSLVAALDRRPDVVAAGALSRPLTFRPSAEAAETLELYRQAGAALALEPGRPRQAAVRALGVRLRQAGEPTSGALQQLLVMLILTEIEAPSRQDDETAFALVQVAGRGRQTFDADALAQLGQARDEMGRRAAHQALRLRARRDRLEREQIQKVLDAAADRAPQPGVLNHDAAARLLIRDFDLRIARADADAAKAGVRRDPGPTSLVRLQAVLSPGEAVLAMAPTVGGFAYMCVRADAVVRGVRAGDAARLRLDTRLVQAALTATHAPSDRLDIQFPVEASVRLYDVLIRPFEGCLKPGDRIVWLSGVAGAALPLSALLPSAPPKIEGGYDLRGADWLVRRHAISYAGSAAAILAARTAGGAAGDLDFLGVGDPVLRPRPGADPARQLLRGTRLDVLAPLPETRDELEASARSFGAARVLTQDAATERGLRQEMVGAYRYLSFATHGLMRDDLQGLSEPALVLTPVNAADLADDGLLTASEIADMNLRAVFVALSACNTANFDLSQFAQDLPALASAFAVAGVPSTLATLWPVNSEAGKRVVADVFASLGKTSAAGPAEALAEAQRRFLDAPPARAYLHPRFWAPFVILGDGGPARRPAPPPRALRAVELLTAAGGEVLNVERTPAGVSAQFISDADPRGRHGAGVRLATDDGSEAWRQDDRDSGASRFGAQLGERRLVGAYRQGASGRFVPVVRAYDDGVVAAAWQGDGLAKVDAFILAGAAIGPDAAVIAVGELNLRDPPAAGGGRLHVLGLTKSLAVQRLFTVEAPAGFRLSDATITPLGADLLVTYTTDQASPLERPRAPDDDYDMPYCLSEHVTWLEVRDGRTGARKAAREVRGLSVVTALGGGDGAVLLAGAMRSGCGQEGRATVLSVTPRLETRTVYRDDSLGASDVRTLAALPGGRTFLAASKENVVTYRPADVAAAIRAKPFSVMPFTSTFSGLLVTLDRNGAPSAPTLLDSGANIYVTAADASRPGDILLGGAIGGQAAIFHLTEAGRAQ